MKSLLVAMLLLMSILPYVVLSAEYKQLFSLDDLTVTVSLTGAKHVSKDAARDVIVNMEENTKYLMRFDPVQRCGRIVVCGNNPSTKTCDAANDAIFLNPMGDGKIYRYEKQSAIWEQKIEKLEDDNILVVLSSSALTFTFNSRTKSEAIVLKAPSKEMRIETSSFYCKVNVGTVAPGIAAVKYFPDMKVPDTSFNANEMDLEPFQTRKSEATGRTYFGPLFRRKSQGFIFGHSPIKDNTCEKEDTKCTAFMEYELDPSALCPHAHDWAGFSRWTEPIDKVDQVKYNRTFFKHPIYRYGLEKLNSPGICGIESGPYQIEIELNQVFDTKLQLNFHRCFGFALVFGAETAYNMATGLELDPAKTFEFYLPAMIFIAPDTEKVRALRINRSDLKKIRISFYTATTQDYAIVEYGFLSDNIPGVRERISLTHDSISKFNSVTMFSEGYCEVRVLNANQHGVASPESLCMHLSGCDVLKLRKP